MGTKTFKKLVWKMYEKIEHYKKLIKIVDESPLDPFVYIEVP